MLGVPPPMTTLGQLNEDLAQRFYRKIVYFDFETCSKQSINRGF